MSNWREFSLNACIIFIVLCISVFVYYYSKGECPQGTSPCTSGGFCVPSQHFCNAIDDCPDGEDEDPVLCADLTGSTNLVEKMFNISLATNPEEPEDSEQCDVKYFPEVHCQCGLRTRIFCNHAQLTEVPQDMSAEVTYIVLQNNSIKTLRKNSLKRYNLALLHLEDNGLAYIEPGSFDNQKNLKKLFLSNNELTSIEPKIFSNLKNLECLHLDNNRLSKIDMTNFEGMDSLFWLTLPFNMLTFEEGESFPVLPKLLELFLGNNKIKRISGGLFRNLTQLEFLDLQSNEIQTIDWNTFLNLRKLKELILSSNKLTTLDYRIFTSQRRLSKLCLGSNPIKMIPNEVFFNLINLQSLHLEDVDIPYYQIETFNSLRSLQWIYFKSYSYCAFATTIPRCRPLSDGISSVDQLLFKPIFRYSNWLMCIITLSGNGLVLFGRFLFKDENKNLSIVIKNLAVGDSLMGIYLLIIAYHDLEYRGTYHEKARLWMSSWNCIITGILGMTSIEVSVIFLVFLSVDRYFVITMPYQKCGSLNLKETWRVVFCIWCFALSISIIPVVSFLSSTKYYGVNGLCLPLFIDDPYSIGWQYSAVIFFGINAPSLLIIIYTYAAMFINIKNTRNATPMPINDSQFAIRFFFIVMANIACWLPIIIAKVVVYFNFQVNADVYGWLVVFVLPINSSLNPILYTFTTRKYRRRLVKIPSCLKKLTKMDHISDEIFNIPTIQDIKSSTKN